MATKLVSPDVDALRVNLLTLWREQTSAEDTSAGLVWYNQARDFAARLAGQHNVALETAASVIASLSPQLDWDSNKRAAEAIFEGRRPSAVLGRNVGIAFRILADGATSPDAYYKHAPKVRSFARNIAGLSDYVTVDTHAAEAAHNDISTVPKVARWYDVYAAAYRAAAAEAGMSPAVFQAVIWTTWKRIHPPAQKRAVRRTVQS